MILVAYLQRTRERIGKGGSVGKKEEGGGFGQKAISFLPSRFRTERGGTVTRV
jgi:hypothetical protein